MSEITNRFNPNFELSKLMKFINFTDNSEGFTEGKVFYKNSIKIGKWYCTQKLMEDGSNDNTNSNYYSLVMGKFNGDRYDLTKMDTTDQYMLNRLKQFIRDFYTFFEITKNENEAVDFCNFFLFMLTIVAFDHESNYSTVIDRYKKLSLDLFYNVDLIDLSTIFDKSYTPSTKIPITKNLSEPWFTAVCNRSKTIEGRLNKGDWVNIEVGDLVYFANEEHKVMVKIISINYFKSFRDYLENEGLERCLPSVTTIDDGLAVYDGIFSQDDQNQYLVKSFHIELV